MHGVCDDSVQDDKTNLEFVVTRKCGDCMQVDKTKLETTRMQESAQDIGDTI
jgi:hypothetical protein